MRCPVGRCARTTAPQTGAVDARRETRDRLAGHTNGHVGSLVRSLYVLRAQYTRMYYLTHIAFQCPVERRCVVDSRRAQRETRGTPSRPASAR